MNTSKRHDIAQRWILPIMLAGSMILCGIAYTVFAVDPVVQTQSAIKPVKLNPAATKKIARVILMPPESNKDVRHEYKKNILIAALEATRKSHGDYEIVTKPGFVKDIRAFHELVRPGNTINVLFAITTEEREALAIPIRIPLRKSLVSYRLLMIPKSSEARFAEVETLDDLKVLTAGLRKTWVSAKIFEASGLSTAHTEERVHLFSMLPRKRFDYIPLGVNEIYKELELRKDSELDLMIAPNIALYVTLPLYIFVSPNEPELAKRIELGLEAMIQNGEFNRLFEAEFSNDIEKAQLHKRNIIHIENHLLPKNLPLERSELWFDPQS